MFIKQKITLLILIISMCTAPVIYSNLKNNGANTEIKVEDTNEGEIGENNDPMKSESTKDENAIAEKPVKSTFYDTYSPNEIDLLLRVVEAETRDCEFDVKCNVVSVIFNRVESSRFPQNTLTDVLLAPKQFAVVSNGSYKNVKVTYDTVDAVEYVFEYGDTAADALYFETMKSNVHGGYATYIFNDGIHKYYK